jgi:hypothetical protein
MAKLRLHLDADTSRRSLQQALERQGHDVSRTPSTWMPLDASDLDQLLGATAQGRCIFTFNARDFIVLGQRYTQHRGIILAAQQTWTLAELIRAVNRLMNETEDSDWTGQVRWLNQWR